MSKLSYKYIISVQKKRRSWYWVLKSVNGQTVATSETYSSKAKANKTAKALWESFKDGMCVMTGEVKIKIEWD